MGRFIAAPFLYDLTGSVDLPRIQNSKPVLAIREIRMSIYIYFLSESLARLLPYRTLLSCLFAVAKWEQGEYLRANSG